MEDLTVIAVDWSGAKGTRRTKSIWVAEIDSRGQATDRGGWTREEVIEHVCSCPGPAVVGFDFAFGVPAWFAREEGCATATDVWERAALDGDRWLAPTPPFWRAKCELPEMTRFRRCESAVRALGHHAKSVFQCVGAGQVGPGSVRGMPLLAVLRARGFAIWPFDAPGPRTAIEIYPTLLRARAPDLDTDDFTSPNRRDAVVSARVMWRHRSELANLRATDDPTVRLEGEIWVPGGVEVVTRAGVPADDAR